MGLPQPAGAANGSDQPILEISRQLRIAGPGCVDKRHKLTDRCPFEGVPWCVTTDGRLVLPGGFNRAVTGCRDPRPAEMLRRT